VEAALRQVEAPAPCLADATFACISAQVEAAPALRQARLLLPQRPRGVWEAAWESAPASQECEQYQRYAADAISAVIRTMRTPPLSERCGRHTVPSVREVQIRNNRSEISAIVVSAAPCRVSESATIVRAHASASYPPIGRICAALVQL